MAHKTTFLAGLIFLLSSLLFAQGELYGPVYIIGDDGRLYIDHIPDTVTASYLAVIDDGWLKKLDIDNLELDTSNIAGLYDYLNAKSDTGHVHDTSDVTDLHDMLAGKSDVGHNHDTRYYTKTQLQTSGGSQVHAGNITNAPWLTGNPFDQDLNTTDRVKFDGVINQNAGVDSYRYRNVASTRLSGTNTGTIKITMPQSWSNTMLTIKISGYEHDAGWWECIITGYNYSSWSNRTCELRGNPPFSDVRLAHDGTKCCLLLGNTSTSWRYPNIHITDVITGHSNYSVWSTGWSIDLITDETGITNIATPDVDRPWHDGNLDPSDYYTKTNLQTSGGSQVHWENITNEPAFITDVDWNEIGGDQSSVNVSGFNNDAGYLTSLPSHTHNELRGSNYVSGGLETPDFFGAGKLRYQMLKVDGSWHDALWISSYRGGDVKGSNQIVMNKKDPFIGFRLQNYDATEWGTLYELYGSHNFSPSDYALVSHNHDDRYLTGNPFDQDLNTTDRVKFDGVINQNAGVNSYHYRSVASRRFNNSSTTGTMKITMPQSWSNTMLTIKISGYNYSSTTGWWECIVNGYNYSSTSRWYYTKCELRGNPLFSDVRLAYDGTKCCLLLGNTSTSWSYPNVHITDVITGYNNYSGWSTGWSIDLITDESGISNIATPDVDRPWHSGNLDTANIARRNVENVFTGVNTFTDSVKTYKIKPVNSNLVHIDLGQDGKNYGAYFRHIDAPYAEGSITMQAKNSFDVASDGRVQLVSGEKMFIRGDVVQIQRDNTTTQIYMDSDNKISIAKVSDTLLPLNYGLADTLMLGRKYGIGVLGFGGTDDLVGGNSPNLFGYSYDFQPIPSLAGNLTYTATKHNFNGDVVIDDNFYALNQGDTLIETGNIGDSAFVKIGKYFTVYSKGTVPGTILGPYAACGNFAAQGYVTTPLVRNPNGAVIINNIMQCVEGLGVAIGGGLTVGNPTGGLKGAGTINAEAIYDDNVKLTGYVLDKAYNKDFKLSDWDSKEKEHVPARKFNAKADSLLDVNTYSAMLKRDKVLPAFKEMEESGEVESVGSVLQKLWETVETQAVHIAELNERIKMLEKAK